VKGEGVLVISRNEAIASPIERLAQSAEIASFLLAMTVIIEFLTN
jgi:hypothetical protein